jgi:ligand-binding sensor domain-containing protein/signal transduction histidine kinase
MTWTFLLTILSLLPPAVPVTEGVLVPGGATDYLVDVWQDALPQISAWAVTQDSDGFVWIGTEEGLVRFDGVELKVFDKSNTPALSDHFVRSLLVGRDDALWIGTGSSLVRLEGGRFTAFGQPDGLPPGEVHALYEDRQGELWIGAEGGLARFDGHAFQVWTTADGLPDDNVLSFAEESGGHLWIGTGAGLRLFDGERFSSPTDLGIEDLRIEALYEDRQQRLWIGTSQGLFRRPRDGQLERLAALDTAEIFVFHERPDGELWIGTKRGLVRWGDRPTLYTSPGVLPDTHVTALALDTEEGLWIGTRYGGLVRFGTRHITPLGTPEGLSDDLVWSIYQDRQGAIWIATDGGLDRLATDGTLTHLTMADGLPEPDVGALYEDRRGRLWVGTFGAGLVRLEKGKIEVLSEGFPAASVRCLLEDSAAAMWAGTRDGLVRLDISGDGDVERLRVFTTADGLPDDHIRGLHEDSTGQLWILTQGGLARRRPGQEIAFEAVGALAGSLKSLYGDTDGTLWIGTWGSGLIRWRHGVAEHFTAADGLHDDRVHQVVEDGNGQLWISSNRGIFRVAKANLEAFAAGRVAKLTSVAYDESYGMRSRECNGGSQPAALRGRDGRLYFATIQGVAIVNPQSLTTHDVMPPVLIEEVHVDQQRISSDHRAIFAAGMREIDFHYSAPSFLDPEKIRFRYRLEGYDETWVEIGSRRTMQYTNLDPGSYRFEVSASSREGHWSEVGDVFEFEVLPAFHQTLGFRLLGALALVGVFWSVYQIRVRSLVRRNEKLQRMKEELEQKNDVVEAQKTELTVKNAELERFTYTVSHDLKSPLFTIEGFLGLLAQDARTGNQDGVTEDVQHIREAIDQMRRLLEDLLELSRVGRVVATLAEVDLVELTDDVLALVAGGIAERGAEIHLDLQASSVYGDRRRIQEVFQNLVENALKYMGDAPRPRIEIGAVDKGGEVHCRVRDNGLGIEPRYREKVFDLFEQLDASVDGTGIGLALVQRIVEVHGGRIWVESAGRDQGSTFYFTLPTRTT